MSGELEIGPMCPALCGGHTPECGHLFDAREPCTCESGCSVVAPKVEIVGAPEGATPAGLRWFEELLNEACPDCRAATVTVYWRTDEQIVKGVEFGTSASRWAYRTVHDDDCPTLTRSEP